MPETLSLGLVLALQLGVTLVAMVGLWAIAARIRDVSFIDAVWAYGMVGLALLSLWQATWGRAADTYRWVLCGLVVLWGLRLGTHLFIRWRRSGRDARYDKILGPPTEPGWRAKALFKVFILQAFLLFFVSLPAQVGIVSARATEWSVAATFATLVALTGIVMETMADAQLTAFRRDPTRKGQVLDTGLWRYSRHPNYFGDALTWWGIFALAVIATPLAWWTLPAPMFLTWTLMHWSGAPLLERGLRKRRPDYEEYIKRTSAFIPWPPAPKH